jgi:hypothetical protein
MSFYNRALKRKRKTRTKMKIALSLESLHVEETNQPG